MKTFGSVLLCFITPGLALAQSNAYIQSNEAAVADVAGGDFQKNAPANYPLWSFLGGGEGGTARENIIKSVGGSGTQTEYAVIAGGRQNLVTASYGAICGGYDNLVSANGGVIAGGQFNEVSDGDGAIGGGTSNTVSATDGFIGGGVSNVVSGDYAAVGGGKQNTATNEYAAVCGGIDNDATGVRSFVGGGDDNNVSEDYGAIAGGLDNNVTGERCFIGGGSNNSAGSSWYGTVGGGYSNNVTGDKATIAGGDDNDATGGGAFVGGGYSNNASGSYGTIPGGYNNTASGSYSFAAGNTASADTAGCWAWGDSSPHASYPLNCGGTGNRMVARSANGVTFYTNQTLTAGVTVGAGGGAFASVSDRNVKDDIEIVDPLVVLERVGRMPISTWRYMAEKSRALHMGPMAQDFYEAFGLGDNDVSITTIDSDGVALASIQGLYLQNQKHQEELTQLRAENAAQRAELERVKALEARLNALESKMAE